ncbi:surface-adhesin E family protein [Cupriavidus basilensis]
MVAAPDPSAPDPQRWLPLMGANGVVSYFDKSSVRRRGPEVGVAVMRNAPAGVIRTASGEPIRSSLRRMVFNCATSMYAVVEQTLYAKTLRARRIALHHQRAASRHAAAGQRRHSCRRTAGPVAAIEAFAGAPGCSQCCAAVSIGVLMRQPIPTLCRCWW